MRCFMRLHRYRERLLATNDAMMMNIEGSSHDLRRLRAKKHEKRQVRTTSGRDSISGQPEYVAPGHNVRLYTHRFGSAYRRRWHRPKLGSGHCYILK